METEEDDSAMLDDPQAPPQGWPTARLGSGMVDSRVLSMFHQLSDRVAALESRLAELIDRMEDDGK